MATCRFRKQRFQVLIDVEATGVGRTVANVRAGNMGDDPDDLPRISGHEVVGRIAETGAGVTHLSPGEHVTVYFHLTCGHCKPCQQSFGSICENHAGWVSAHIDGGFTECVCLPAGNPMPIADGTDPVNGIILGVAGGVDLDDVTVTP